MDLAVSYRLIPLRPVYTKRQRQRCDNSAMMLAMTLSLKSVESLENGLQSHSGANPLFSMRTELQVSSQSCRRVDADDWCKWALWANAKAKKIKKQVKKIKQKNVKHKRKLSLSRSLSLGLDKALGCIYIREKAMSLPICCIVSNMCVYILQQCASAKRSKKNDVIALPHVLAHKIMTL